MKDREIILCLGLLVLFPGVGLAQLQSFKPAQVEETVKPDYPQRRHAGRSTTSSEDSGVVELAYMVDKLGKPYQVMVTRSSMSKFEEPAIKALERYQFQPATVESKPVDSRSSSNVLFRYSALDANSVSGARASQRLYLDIEAPPLFDLYYERFMAESAKPKPGAEKLAHSIRQMVRLEDQTFLSLAYTAIAKSRYADLFGDALQRIDEYQNLIWLNELLEEKYQPIQGASERLVWSQLIGLQIELGMFAEALQARASAKLNKVEVDPAVASHFARIVELKNSAQATLRNLQLGSRGYTQLPLFKRSFEITNVKGNIAQLKLRCDARFEEMEFQVDVNYRIPQSWGECNLQTIGAPDTQAELLQK